MLPAFNGVDRPPTDDRPSEASPRLHLQLAQIRHAGPHQGQVHLHEVVLNTARPSCIEDLLPVQRALPDRNDLARLCRPSLDVHRDKSPRVTGEILRGIVAVADGRYLELKLDVLGIEKLKQHVVSQLAVEVSEL